ncbi:hypothetical protein ID866_8416, partial [Astraeus odoratus]
DEELSQDGNDSAYARQRLTPLEPWQTLSPARIPPQELSLESEELSPPPSPASKPRLKIKLKLPQVLSPNEPSSRAASTPSGEGPSQPSSRRGVSKDYVESEDDEEEDDDDEVVGSSTRPMTSRQAVLASVVGSSHVSLSESSRKKKQLTEEEIALRREETARKRKNLSEKKLEDEKVRIPTITPNGLMETINRLLKKQSKSKNKRNVLSTADERTPVSVTPAMVSSTRDGSPPPEGELQEPVEVAPTMYRWISTTKKPSPGTTTTTTTGAEALEEGKNVKTSEPAPMRLTFSVPVCALPPDGVQGQDGVVRPPSTAKPICDVSGCGRARKYRLVKDWVKGACGMDHLKLLERQMA